MDAGGFFHDLVFNLNINNACNNCRCDYNCCNTTTTVIDPETEYYVDEKGTPKSHSWFNRDATIQQRRARNAVNTVAHLTRKYGDYTCRNQGSDLPGFVSYLAGVNFNNCANEPWTGTHLRVIQVAVNALGLHLKYWQPIQRIYQSVRHDAAAADLTAVFKSTVVEASLVGQLLSRTDGEIRLELTDLQYLRGEGVSLGNLGDLERGKQVARRIYYLARTIVDGVIPTTTFEELVEESLST